MRAFLAAWMRTALLVGAAFTGVLGAQYARTGQVGVAAFYGLMCGLCLLTLVRWKTRRTT
jgi:hypothetical protein